jgi:hypothetical protein
MVVQDNRWGNKGTGRERAVLVLIKKVADSGSAREKEKEKHTEIRY